MLPIAHCALLSHELGSLFWGGITVGRLLAIPLAVRFSTDTLLKANLVGCLLSSAALLAVGRVSGVSLASRLGRSISTGDVWKEPTAVSDKRSRGRFSSASTLE